MYLFYNILGLVPRTVLTTFKALLVIFVNLVVNILLFLEFTLKIREFIASISKKIPLTFPSWKLVPRTLPSHPPQVTHILLTRNVSHRFHSRLTIITFGAVGRIVAYRSRHHSERIQHFNTNHVKS